MSKTIAELAQLLGSNNEQLFDRYINFRLTRVKPGTPGISRVQANQRTRDNIKRSLRGEPTIAYDVETINPDLDDDFVIRCPLSGLKPSITVSATFHVQNTANLITLTVVNMNANIDTMIYNYAEVEVGYINSGIHSTFSGQITNCYMAKPNPNGELVVSIVCADIADIYRRGDFEVAFDKEFVTTTELIQTCVQAIVDKYPDLTTDLLTSLSYSAASTGQATNLPGEWLYQTFLVNKSTYRFRSPLECITWLNSLFASGTYNTGFSRGAGGLLTSSDVASEKLDLPPLRLGFDSQGRLRLTSTYSNVSPGTVKALSCIGSAFLTGTSTATVTAPFNPNISPGEVIYINPKYFRTRVNVTEEMRAKYKSMGNLWYVIEIQFTFSTMYANTMTLMLNNINNKIKTGEG